MAKGIKQSGRKQRVVKDKHDGKNHAASCGEFNPPCGIKKIGVVGAGTMGRGIAQVFALYGFPVVLVDRDKKTLDGALEKIKEHTDPELWKGVNSLITTSKSMKKLKTCDVVIEAVFERMQVKRAVLESLKDVVKKSAIIATNTSSISINELAAFVNDESRFIGMHFMNPPKVMKLVEVIRGERTSDETTDKVCGLAEALEKVPAVVNDSPGFVSNRLLFALIGEAIRLLESGVATKESIDTVMKFGMNHPMGPIELADFIGLDVCKEIMLYIYDMSSDEKFFPPEILVEKITHGKLGRKSGEGFYKYE